MRGKKLLALALSASMVLSACPVKAGYIDGNYMYYIESEDGFDGSCDSGVVLSNITAHSVKLDWGTYDLKEKARDLVDLDSYSFSSIDIMVNGEKKVSLGADVTSYKLSGLVAERCYDVDVVLNFETEDDVNAYSVSCNASFTTLEDFDDDADDGDDDDGSESSVPQIAYDGSVSVDRLTSTSAYVDWDSTEMQEKALDKIVDIVGEDAEYTFEMTDYTIKVGDGSKMDVDGVSTPYQLTDLAANTEYEVTVEMVYDYYNEDESYGSSVFVVYHGVFTTLPSGSEGSGSHSGGTSHSTQEKTEAKTSAPSTPDTESTVAEKPTSISTEKPSVAEEEKPEEVTAGGTYGDEDRGGDAGFISKNIKPTSVTLDWTNLNIESLISDNDYELTMYVLEVGDDETQIPVTQTVYELTNLKPDTYYSVWLNLHYMDEYGYESYVYKHCYFTTPAEGSEVEEDTEYSTEKRTSEQAKTEKVTEKGTEYSTERRTSEQSGTEKEAEVSIIENDGLLEYAYISDTSFKIKWNKNDMSAPSADLEYSGTVICLVPDDTSKGDIVVTDIDFGTGEYVLTGLDPDEIYQVGFSVYYMDSENQPYVVSANSRIHTPKQGAGHGGTVEKPTEPNTEEPAGKTEEPAGKTEEPAGKTEEPAGKTEEPTGRTEETTSSGTVEEKPEKDYYKDVVSLGDWKKEDGSWGTAGVTISNVTDSSITIDWSNVDFDKVVCYKYYTPKYYELDISDGHNSDSTTIIKIPLNQTSTTINNLTKGMLVFVDIALVFEAETEDGIVTASSGDVVCVCTYTTGSFEKSTENVSASGGTKTTPTTEKPVVQPTKQVITSLKTPHITGVSIKGTTVSVKGENFDANAKGSELILYDAVTGKKAGSQIGSYDSWIVSNVKRDKSYYIQVRIFAYNGNNKIYSDWSAKKYFISAPDVKADKSNRKTKDRIEVKWSKVNGATNYTVYVRKSKSGKWYKVGSTKKTKFVIKKCGKAKIKSKCKYDIKVVSSGKVGGVKLKSIDTSYVIVTSTGK